MGDLKKFCTAVLFDGGIIPNFVDKHTDPSHFQHLQSAHPSWSAQFCLLGQMSLQAVVRWEGEKLHFFQAIRQYWCKDLPSSVPQPEPLVICFLSPAFFENSNVIFIYLHFPYMEISRNNYFFFPFFLMKINLLKSKLLGSTVLQSYRY